MAPSHSAPAVGFVMGTSPECGRRRRDAAPVNLTGALPAVASTPRRSRMRAPSAAPGARGATGSLVPARMHQNGAPCDFCPACCGSRGGGRSQPGAPSARSASVRWSGEPPPYGCARTFRAARGASPRSERASGPRDPGRRRVAALQPALGAHPGRRTAPGLGRPRAARGCARTFRAARGASPRSERASGPRDPGRRRVAALQPALGAHPGRRTAPGLGRPRAARGCARTFRAARGAPPRSERASGPVTPAGGGWPRSSPPWGPIPPLRGARSRLSRRAAPRPPRLPRLSRLPRTAP